MEEEKESVVLHFYLLAKEIINNDFLPEIETFLKDSDPNCHLDNLYDMKYLSYRDKKIDKYNFEIYRIGFEDALNLKLESKL